MSQAAENEVTNGAASESVTADLRERNSPVEPSEVRLKVPAQDKDELPGLLTGRHPPPPQEETLNQTPIKDLDVQSSGRAEPEETDRETPAAESQWEVGARCRAVWSKDGRVYPATVMCVDGGRCRIRFKVYGNEEDVDLTALQSPRTAPPTQTQDPRVWSSGSRCRAVYSQDGLVYPAVVLWVKGQRCRVRFDSYNNEEEQEVSSLLSSEDLHGPSRILNKGSSWKKREEIQGGGERRSGWREDRQSVSEVKEKLSQSDKETKDNQRGDEKPTNHSSRLFPPFPHPAQLLSGEPLTCIPPPPLWTLGEKESSDVTYTMLMLWYMCGFHTGSFMAQQGVRSTSKD